MSGMVCVVVALLACSRASAPTAGPFDGQKALEYAKAQVDFGPRVPGTAAHDKAGAWIVEQMRQRADTVIEQRWTHLTSKGDSFPLLNVLARFRPDAGERVLYVTHWDTRPTSDQETDEARRKLPISGANDGASDTE